MSRLIGLVLLAGLLIGSLAAFGADTPLIIGTIDSVDELSFANSWDMYSWHVLRATCDALLKLNDDTLELEGAIAQSWDVSDDGLVYTFHIRPGITFTDGTVCDANAVKFSLDRTLRLDGPKGAVSLIYVINTISVLDDLTVQITLDQPDVTFLLAMTNQIAPAMIYSAASAPGDEFDRGRYAGCGPYKLVEYVPDQYVKYEANPTYYGKQPVSRLVIERHYSDASSLRAAIESGEIDVAFRTLNPEDITDLQGNPQVVIESWPPSPGIRYLLFNVTNPPVDNPFVRQAVCYAVDRSAIISQVFGGTVQPIYTMVPNVDPPFFGALPTFPERDLAKARQLLATVGYNEQNPLVLSLPYTPSHYGTFEADVATVIAASLEETGVIQVNIEALEWGAYLDQMSSGAFGMFLLGWHPDYLETSNFLGPWTTDGPESMGTYFDFHPNYQAYKDIMEVARATVDTVKRGKLYQAIQILSTQDVPWIPLWSMTDEMVTARLPNVHGLKLDVTMDIDIWNIYKS
jgi:peptide/nickel transport system substrate-binding protein